MSDSVGTGRAWYLIITGIVLIIDQLTKYWASAALKFGGEIMVIKGLAKFNYTENAGIAFGMLNNGDMRWLLVAVSVLAISVVLLYLMRVPLSGRFLLVALALLAGGISGNLVDRIRMGSVIDFIELYYQSYHWPVFNVADTAITIGAVLLGIDVLAAPQQGKLPAGHTEMKEVAGEEQG